jgi:putative tricarboxylic transport membrane protein
LKLNDTFLGALLLLAAAAIWISAQSFSRLPNQSYGSETMPLALAAMALALGVYMVARGVLSGFPMPKAVRADWARSPVGLVGFGAAIALVVAYIVLENRLGFVPTAALIIFALMLVMQVRWWLAAPLALVATLAIQQSFGRLLLVPLPRNDFLSFLW